MPIDHDAIAARVRQEREKGTPGPWAYRPQEFDDWGVVRTCADGEGRMWFVCQARDHRSFDEGILAKHRIARTDPWEANARRIAHVPDLEAAYLDLYDKVTRLLAALDDIAAAAFWIANEIHIGPEDEGRDLYDMALAIRDDARAAMKGDSDE